jgi:hypothetical protein
MNGADHGHSYTNLGYKDIEMLPPPPEYQPPTIAAPRRASTAALIHRLPNVGPPAYIAQHVAPQLLHIGFLRLHPRTVDIIVLGRTTLPDGPDK